VRRRNKDWGSLHNGQLHNSYSSPNIIRVILIVTGVIGAVWKLTLCFQLFGGSHCLHLQGKKVSWAGIWCVLYREGWHGWDYKRGKGNSWPLKGPKGKHFPWVTLCNTYYFPTRFTLLSRRWRLQVASKYWQNSHFHNVLWSKNRITITSKPIWKPHISNHLDD
jgi:hypothetical protein